MNRYPCSLDKLSVIITWCIAGIGFVTFLACYVAYVKSGKDSRVLAGALAGPLFLFVLFIAMYYLKPTCLVVDGEGITIERKLKPVVIKFTEIKSIRIAEAGEMKGAIRTFGNGGLFGYTGYYYNRKLGSMRWHCTQRTNYVIIDKSNNKKVIVTPDDPEVFLARVLSLQPSLKAI
jgi:hypothetical protein